MKMWACLLYILISDVKAIFFLPLLAQLCLGYSFKRQDISVHFNETVYNDTSERKDNRKRIRDKFSCHGCGFVLCLFTLCVWMYYFTVFELLLYVMFHFEVSWVFVMIGLLLFTPELFT